LLHPDDRDGLARAVTVHLREREPFKMEYRLRTKSGDYRWFRGRGQSRLDKNGKILRMSGSIRDITQQKRAEDQQRILDTRLLELEKLESLGVFARGFAHDFNNLLTSVMGNASFALLTLPPTSPLRQNMEAIEHAASHGEELAEQLLAYAGEGRGLPAHLDLSTFIEETAPLLAATVPERIVLDYRLRRALPPIVADPTQMRQVLVNLVTNAAQAIGAADGLITVSTGTVRVNDDDGATDWTGQAPLGRACPYIKVSDTGPGIDEGTQAKMWDPFFSARTTGRGLGLAVVQGVARSHGGRVRVVSQLGAGTAIEIRFPGAQAAERQSPAGGLVRGAEGAGAHQLADHV
jgi:signal transduction histidine kinase